MSCRFYTTIPRRVNKSPVIMVCQHMKIENKNETNGLGVPIPEIFNELEDEEVDFEVKSILLNRETSTNFVYVGDDSVVTDSFIERDSCSKSFKKLFSFAK